MTAAPASAQDWAAIVTAAAALITSATALIAAIQAHRKINGK